MQVGPRTRQGGRRQEYPATAVARTVTTARPLHHAEGQPRGNRGEGQHRGGRSRGVEYPATAVVRTDTTAIPLHKAEDQTTETRGEGQHRGGRSRGIPSNRSRKDRHLSKFVASC